MSSPTSASRPSTSCADWLPDCLPSALCRSGRACVFFAGASRSGGATRRGLLQLSNRRSHLLLHRLRPMHGSAGFLGSSSRLALERRRSWAGSGGAGVSRPGLGAWPRARSCCSSAASFLTYSPCTRCVTSSSVLTASSRASRSANRANRARRARQRRKALRRSGCRRFFSARTAR